MSVKRPEPRRASSEPPLSKIHNKRQRVQHSSQGLCLFDPPITIRSLRELELPEILRNGKLRHDCVYDRLLHFRPNIEGKRGKRKSEESKKYWDNVGNEITKLKEKIAEQQDPETIQIWWLPVMFSNIRDILLTLVPKADRPAIRDVMDEALIRQRLVRGVFDITAFAHWLAGLLKCHCAPMRDKSVHRFTERISYGVSNNNVQALIEGLRLVFEVLEAMRLDVANHQIRTLRPHLVQDSVNFEKAWFKAHLVSTDAFKEAMLWYRKRYNKYNKDAHVDTLQTFLRASVELLRPSSDERFPSTFTFDVERLAAYKEDVRDAVCLRVAMLLFRRLLKRESTKEESEHLTRRLLAILDAPQSYRWNAINDIALEIYKTASEFNQGASFKIDLKEIQAAEAWLVSNFQTKSAVFQILETRVLESVYSTVKESMKGWSALSTFPVGFTADVRGDTFEEANIGQRAFYVFFLNWRVFGQEYCACVEPPKTVVSSSSGVSAVSNGPARQEAEVQTARSRNMSTTTGEPVTGSTGSESLVSF
ncbi:Tcp11-domain-containing protein [Ascobolus immersus RN42]|uniref:Tcp11-domain-containing protein n=1 Tax=Ascobolus immersus RN42 TaxID=1160509 RepID=A0A3N4HNT4_ASCIM|nr:Tcp11-domain-containing protein [Ascobolus immersus RN42]